MHLAAAAVVVEEKIDEILVFVAVVRLHSSFLDHQRDPKDRILFAGCWTRSKDQHLLDCVHRFVISP